MLTTPRRSTRLKTAIPATPYRTPKRPATHPIPFATRTKVSEEIVAAFLRSASNHSGLFADEEYDALWRTLRRRRTGNLPLAVAVNPWLRKTVLRKGALFVGKQRLLSHMDLPGALVALPFCEDVSRILDFAHEKFAAIADELVRLWHAEMMHLCKGGERTQKLFEDVLGLASNRRYDFVTPASSPSKTLQLPISPKPQRIRRTPSVDDFLPITPFRIDATLSRCYLQWIEEKSDNSIIWTAGVRWNQGVRVTAIHFPPASFSRYPTFLAVLGKIAEENGGTLPQLCPALIYSDDEEAQVRASLFI